MSRARASRSDLAKLLAGRAVDPAKRGPRANCVLGIDPGTRKLGFGVVERQGSRLVPLSFGTLDIGSIEPFTQRLVVMHDELTKIIAEFKPDAAAIEEVFYGRNVKSALRSAEGRGAVMLSLGIAGLTVNQYAATVIKRAATGRGDADKSQVAAMITTLLNLKTPPAPDAADALAVAICHLNRNPVG